MSRGHALLPTSERQLREFTGDDETPSLDLEPDDGFEPLLGGAVHYRIATGPHAGRKAPTLRTLGSSPPPDTPCIAQLSGFSLHAGTRCQGATPSNGLGRYIARPALSYERLSVNDRGQVVYRLKHPFGDATTHVVLHPIDFIARLAALVPRPRAHLTRVHGVFAPNFNHRHRIVPNPVHQSAREPHTPRPAPMRWMQRLQRLFHIHIEHCGVCGGTFARHRVITGGVAGGESGTSDTGHDPVGSEPDHVSMAGTPLGHFELEDCRRTGSAAMCMLGDHLPDAGIDSDGPDIASVVKEAE